MIEDQSSQKSCLRWQWTRITCSLGFVFILVSIISFIVMPFYVEYKILAKMPLKNGSEVYENWIKPPVTPRMMLYVFNVTNHEAFLAGREKPNLVELGPYMYRQEMLKANISFSEDSEELSHSVHRKFYFEPSYDTKLSDEDIVIVPNIPMFGLIKKLKSSDPTEKSVTRNLIESYSDIPDAIDTKPFIKVTVKELFWGYPSIFLSMQRLTELGDKCKDSDDDIWGDFGDFNDENADDKVDCDIKAGNLVPFGVFSMRNGTYRGFRTIKTGKTNSTDKGLMVAWKGSNDAKLTNQLNYWKSDQCNKVVGRDPSGLPLNIGKSDIMKLFIGQLCRPLDFVFAKNVNVDDEFNAMRFMPNVTSFSSPDKVPENQCYCHQKPCLPSGLLDISGCEPDSPIYLSWPHFLHGDPYLRKLVQGLAPDEQAHSFILDVLPKYGVALRAQARFQMNVIVEKNDTFNWFKDIQDDVVYLPIMWLDEGISGPSKTMRDKVRYLYSLPTMVTYLQTLGFFALGILLLVPEIILWSKSCFADLR